MSKNLIVILGPTASGKSALAVALAQRVNGEVISADSRQVYRGMDIGSGKITKREMKGIPHHLLDVSSPRYRFTVTHYQKRALKAINDVWRRSKTPILCGGTGLYIHAVTDGIIIPEVKPNFTLRKKLEKMSVEQLFQLLKKKDSRRASIIDPHNPRRLIRALEIIDTLGKVPQLKSKPLDAHILFIGIKKDKEELKKLITARLHTRLKKGMIQEVKNLHIKGASWKRLEDFGLEYRFIAQFLQKKITEREMIDFIIKESVQYAKRQMTWFSSHNKKGDNQIHWITNQKQAFSLINNFLTKNPKS